MGKQIIIKGANFSDNGFKNLLGGSFTVNQQGYLGSVYPDILTYNDKNFWTYGMQVEAGKQYKFCNFVAATGCNIACVASGATPVVSASAQFTTPEMVSAVTHFSSKDNNKVLDIVFTATSNYILFSVKDKDAINSMFLLEE